MLLVRSCHQRISIHMRSSRRSLESRRNVVGLMRDWMSLTTTDMCCSWDTWVMYRVNFIPTLSHDYCLRLHPVPDILVKITISVIRLFQNFHCKHTHTHTQAKTIQNTVSIFAVIVESRAAVQIKQSVQWDMRPCRNISPSTDSQLSWEWLPRHGITVTSLPVTTQLSSVVWDWR